uniref:Putative ovule protein n=1 Tax=Solanum chacoense TaxID=4108 RepID=A0A0V0HM41_SOLCH
MSLTIWYPNHMLLKLMTKRRLLASSGGSISTQPRVLLQDMMTLPMSTCLVMTILMLVPSCN